MVCITFVYLLTGRNLLKTIHMYLHGGVFQGLVVYRCWIQFLQHTCIEIKLHVVKKQDIRCYKLAVPTVSHIVLCVKTHVCNSADNLLKLKACFESKSKRECSILLPGLHEAHCLFHHLAIIKWACLAPCSSKSYSCDCSVTLPTHSQQRVQEASVRYL